jgi:hypothetical protein
MTPLVFLLLTLLATAAAVGADLLVRRHRRSQLLALAADLKMAYSPHDRFALAERVAQHFPIPGAAAVRVVDLLYASDARGYRYLFCAQYTIGVIRSKSPQRRAAALVEPRGATPSEIWSTLHLAPAHLPLLDQYRHLAQTEKTEKKGT